MLTIVLSGISSCSSRLALKGNGDSERLEFTRASKPEKLEVSSRPPDRSLPPSSVESENEGSIPRLVDGDCSNGCLGGSVALEQLAAISQLAENEQSDSIAFNSAEEVLNQEHSYGMARNEHSRSKEWKQQFQHVLKSAYSIAPSSQDGAGKGLVVAGIVILSLGFLVLLFLNWVIGLLLMLVGAALWIAGATGNKSSTSGSSEKKKKDEEQPEWQDVVYLKNGSIIKGLIIEQVPNESIKIQTTDGSVFVHAMDQVAKITKEQKK